MPSPELSAPQVRTGRGDVRRDAAGLRALLDTTFGYVVWAAHLLVVYIATAVLCQLGLGTGAARSRTSFLAVLALLSVAAAALVALHAARRYRQQRAVSSAQFRMTVTIGNDALAIVAICWQLLAITLVPVCV